MNTQCVVLLSGGMDSTVALALNADSAVLALSVDYGQRHVKEIGAAVKIADHYGVEHKVLDLTGWGRLLTGSSLTDRTVPVPHGHYAAPTMAATIVPNRNATMLMAAAGVAISAGASRVVIAAHSGDHPVYPDCRPEFIDAIAFALRLGTDQAVTVDAPFRYIDKTGIARRGVELGAPLDLSWSCYEGGDLHCGQCGTCQERRGAFIDAGLVDPTEYADLTPIEVSAASGEKH